MFRTLQIQKTLKMKLPSFKKAVKDDSSSSPDEASPVPEKQDASSISPGLTVDTVNNKSADTVESASNAPAKVIIAGGGIVGLLMALALKKHVNVHAEVYEQAEKFEDDVGAGMGLYANGLRVIRDIDPSLLRGIQEAGCPYLYRRWERHDGMQVAEADECILGTDDGELRSMGIRRWRLQQCLHSAVSKAGIPIYFGKKIQAVAAPEDGTMELTFTDGSRRQTELLIAADGGRSVVRTALLEMNKQNRRSLKGEKKDTETPKLNYTGVTCIMGVARKKEDCCLGISFPVSNTTKCHGAFYPTGTNEQCFQFHFPIGCKNNDVDSSANLSWGNLSQQVSRDECGKLAEILEADGWDEEKYLRPLRQVTRAVKVGFCELSPRLKHWSFPNARGQPRTILVGDAAHPPVPYLGQGAQQGMEDVGTLALLLKKFCLDNLRQFDLHNLGLAVKVYEKLRIPRADYMLNNAVAMGEMERKMANNCAYNIIKEEKIQRNIFFHETMPVMFAGARHDYREALEAELEIMAKYHECPTLEPIAEA